MPIWVNTCSTPTATATMTTTTVRLLYTNATATATTATTGWITWTGNDDWATVVTRPIISPARLYIARRSYRQALADDLHDLYSAEQHRQQREMAKHQEQASKRSLELLLAHLTPAQRETFDRNKWFVVEGGKSGQRYRIRHAGHMVANIDVLDGEKINHRLCGHCDLREVPLFDQLLAQKMMLEYDEERFLKLANRHRGCVT